MKRRFILLGLVAAFAPLHTARAQQTTYVVDHYRSLVWWQLDPHFGHLWATSCPNDPSWMPGEGHSQGYNTHVKNKPKIRTTKEAAGVYPLFPRDTVRANCKGTVSGTFTTSDAKRFSQLKGMVQVSMDSVINGSDARDLFAHKYIYSAAKYPTTTFTVDSLTNINFVGDTVNAVAVGTWVFRGVESPTRVQVQGVRDPSGLRVRGLWAFPAKDLTQKYGISRTALTMGVGAKLWDTVFMGLDFILIERKQ
ncbi:MAG TPA: YceI family protein [Longimicrobiales bacterium]|nr:YceI family protein [Longimicrobiales bacterium]